MTKRFLALALIATSCTTQEKLPEAPAVASATPAVTLSESFSVTFCNRKKKCDKPVILGTKEITLKLEPFHKGDASGLSGADTNSVTERNVPFKSEVRITRKSSTDDYDVYMMIRSGPTVAREGKIKTLTVKSLAELANVQLQDEPIVAKGGTVQATLIINVKP